MKAEPVEVRLWRRVDKTGECWLWQGTRLRDGYGMIGVRHPKVTQLLVHRVSWELANGPIPAGRQVLHRCDNPPCVRPDHLFLGTNRANVADRVAKGRSRGASRERNAKAKLTSEQVAQIRALYRKGAHQHLDLRFGVTRSTIYHIARGWTWPE